MNSNLQMRDQPDKGAAKAIPVDGEAFFSAYIKNFTMAYHC